MVSKLRYCFSILLFLLTLSVFSQNDYWAKKGKTNSTDKLSKFHLQENKVQFFKLNQVSLQQQLASATLRGRSNKISNTIIDIPGVNGALESFKIYEAQIFSPSLAAKFPNIKSYIGFSTNNSGATLRMSVSPNGVQTMVTYTDKPALFMQPMSHDSSDYVLYDKGARGDYQNTFECKTIDKLHKTYRNKNTANTNRNANDQTLRKFRLAMSVNGEYTTYHGGTVADALAAINATITRVNAVFETDMAVTFELVDATQLIYTDAATDPYSTSLDNWNEELQNTLTNTIGNAAYDIGHMFGASGGGGNAGCIGCVCIDDTTSTTDLNKGAGITSPSDGIPEGDNFDIDFVAHEIGHQMGANHTFSHITEGTGVNAEPGSGTTVMAYAGITGVNNVQLHSDAYFHYYSIKQILDNLVNRTCWTGTTITNNPPIASAGSDYTIPQGTAYILKGSATDADGGDTLSYCWEQTDSGQVTNTSFGPALTSGSMNRSLPPSSSSDRYIPKLNRVIAGQLTQTNPTINSDWETVSTVGRTLNWALTVRDRAPSAIGLNGQSSFDLMQITVDATSGPFVVTSQSTNVTWDVGSNQDITWDVAGTNVAPVNTTTVNIKLSIDGGLTYPINLASNITNDGSHNITVPAVGGDTTTARIMVEGNNNIFYALNETNFSIQESEFVLNVSNTTLNVCEPNDAVFNFTYNTFLGFTGTTTFSTTNLPAGATAVFSPTTASADDTAVTVTISGTTTVGIGNYAFKLVGTSGAITKDGDVNLNVFSSTFSTLSLSTPVNGASNIPANGNLTWTADVNAQDYVLEIASDAGFASVVESASPTSNSYTTTALAINTEYYWRVKPRNLCGEGAFSSVFSFTTQDISCSSFNAIDTPINIPDNNATGITSTLNISNENALVITDINVTINATHPWVGDLTLTLTSPNGTIVTLVSSRNDPGLNYTNTVFDDAATNTIATGSAPYSGQFKPESNLSALNSEFSNGNWVLKVVDSGPADIGSLDSWSLGICGSSPIDALPNNNFTLRIGSETCRSSDNGSINITSLVPLNYTAQLTGNGLDVSNDFTATTDFTGLEAGDYIVCITVENQATYSQCYDVIITEPEDLAVLSRLDASTGRLTLELSGGSNYNITLNGITTITTENEITLELITGINELRVTTDKDCQGVYEKTINNITETLVYPNPIADNSDLNINISDSAIEKVQVTLYSLIGEVLFSKQITFENGKSKINVSNLSTGVYILNINTGKSQTNHKVIKK